MFLWPLKEIKKLCVLDVFVVRAPSDYRCLTGLQISHLRKAICVLKINNSLQ